MSDDQLLYFAFLLFYLFDGIIRLPADAWVLVRPTFQPRRWRVIRPVELASRRGEGYGLLPILGACLPTGEGWWFSTGQCENVHVDSPEWSGRVSVIKNPAKYWRERSRLIGPSGSHPLVFPNEHSAVGALRWLRSPAGSRPSRLDLSLSLPRARAAVKKQAIIDRVFGSGVAVLTIYIFLLLPIAFSYYRSSFPRLGFLAAIFPLTFYLACCWHALVNRLFKGEKKRRWYSVLPLALLPYHTLRIPRHLALNLTAGIHPLAMGKVVLSPEDFSAFANQYMRRLRYPVMKEVPPDVWENFYERCADFLDRECGLSRPQWHDSVPPRDPESESFCPRCLSSYLRAEAACQACGGLATVPFPDAERAP